ncbi:hypothetical protein [Sphingomonas sp. 2R-10]|uniref:hypothetical protein n=1 Tax=Sphingomonas sp. 2R-10 TaxID=3045148 RepID=UPI0024B9045E|nr:hypothetical protein [Sphingomonas sp. 2R-10]
MVGAVAATLMLAAVAGCKPPTVVFEGEQETAARGRTILGRIGLPLPDSAVIEHATMERGLDDNARIVAVLPEAAWRPIATRLAARDPAAPPFSAEANAMLGPDAAGWAPRRAPGLRTIQRRWNDGGEVVNVGVAPAGAGRVRLFLFWHEL